MVGNASPGGLLVVGAGGPFGGAKQEAGFKGYPSSEEFVERDSGFCV